MKKKYIAVYTVMFALIAAAVFQIFVRQRITLIHGEDGWTQHYRALVYYAQWWRGILRTLFTEHRLEIPLWSASIGYGADILTTMSYYVLGDPLNLISVAVPFRYMPYCYSFLIVLRIYLAGLAFSAYSKYMGKENDLAVMAGAFCYAFCGYALFGAIKHPFFLNPMIYFPLILMGVEKLKDRKSPVQLVLSVGLAAFSNFYFFYMLVAFTILYVLIRAIASYKRTQIREAVTWILQIGCISFVGVMISGILLVPTLNAFFTDQRTTVSSAFELVYQKSYYKNFLTALTCPIYAGSWTYAGYSVASILAVILLFLKKGRRQLKAGFLICTGLLMSPLAGYALNGFAYVSNRWIWAYSFLIAFILTEVWEELFHLKKREYMGMTAVVLIYFGAACYLDHRHTLFLKVSFCLAVLCLILLFAGSRIRNGEKARKKRWTQYTMAAVIAVGIIGMANLNYTSYGSNYASKFKSLSFVRREFLGKADQVMRDFLEGKEEYMRYTGQNITKNSNLFTGLHNTQFYWSISDPSIADLMHRMQLNEPILWMYKGLDDRTALEALASVGYYVCTEEKDSRVPYGFEKVWEDEEGNCIYENQYALPLGYTYTSAVTREETKDLDALQMQEEMLKNVVLEQDTGTFAAQDTDSGIQDIPYEITCGENVTLEDGSFHVTKKKASVTFTFEGDADSETYLQIYNLEFRGKPAKAALELTCTDESGKTVTKKLDDYTDRFRRYAGKKDFLVNLNYSKEKKTKLTISFSEKGTYSFDRIQILCQNMGAYAGQIAERKASVLEQTELSANRITGNITLDQDKILCLSIPYSKGWTAYVDGEKQETEKANLMYTAIRMKAGSHQIELRYDTPYLRLGEWISAAGMVLLLIIWKRHGAFMAAVQDFHNK